MQLPLVTALPLPFSTPARVEKSAYSMDSKSIARKGLRVRVPPRAPFARNLAQIELLFEGSGEPVDNADGSWVGAARMRFRSEDPSEVRRMRYPPTRRLDLVEELHGFRVGDPYRWLEDGEADETEAWS
jgi:hypothetical protein